ncbi:MAG TPA: SurA N-terminal domain-containing protein [Euzebyales bacterium]|nr:SurA N-terminal domain-containing protein [Euzebyales bacterium]
MIKVVRRSAVLLVALATSACALTNTGDPNTAAVVGDRQIATSAIERNFEAISDSDTYRQQSQQDPNGQLAAQTQSQLVTALVRSEILDLLAARNDVQVDQAQVDAAVEDIVEQVGGEDQFEERLAAQGVPRELFLQQVRDQQVQAALQEQAGGQGADFAAYVRDEMSDVPIEVNPRFGVWDATGLEVRPQDPLAQPGRQAGAAPTEGP